jgi:hypothetical protein
VQAVRVALAGGEALEDVGGLGGELAALEQAGHQLDRARVVAAGLQDDASVLEGAAEGVRGLGEDAGEDQAQVDGRGLARVVEGEQLFHGVGRLGLAPELLVAADQAAQGLLAVGAGLGGDGEVGDGVVVASSACSPRNTPSS